MKITKPRSFSTKENVILEEAEKYGITWKQIEATRLFELTYQGKKKYFYGGFASSTSLIGYLACLDKRVTRNFLLAANVSIAQGEHFAGEDSDDAIREAFKRLPKPLVLKASHSNNGESVTTNITTDAEFEAALKKARAAVSSEDMGILMEEQVVGNEYRITLNRDKVLAIMARIPANVVGDGTHTIKELAAIKSQDPLRNINPDHNDPYPHIRLDDEVAAILAKNGMNFDNVPAKDQQVFLREVSNLSQGGDSVDLTDEAHPTVKEVALAAIRAIPDLPFAGLDFMTEDLTKPQDQVKHWVIEVNAGPHISIHHYPMQGKPRNIAEELIWDMFPELKPKS